MVQHKKGLPGNLSDYPLDERRTNRYTFTSVKALSRYFSAWLAKEEIEAMVDEAKIGFKNRHGCSDDETRLQFLKKCEYSLVRLLRSGAAV